MSAPNPDIFPIPAAVVAEYSSIVQKAINGAYDILALLPVETDNPTPQPQAQAIDKVAAAIYAYNTSRSYFANATTFSVPLKGVEIHKATLVQANGQSPIFQRSAKQNGLDLCFTLACSGEEGLFDQNAQNENAAPGESNYSPTNPQGASPLGDDMGGEQLKLKYLVGVAPGVTDAASALAFALDPSKAIPYFCSLMAGKVAYAEGIIAKNTSSAPDPRMLNKYVLGTWCYNEGDTGALTDFSNGTFPSHCQQVIDLTNYFAQALGVPSIFANLPK